MKKSIYEIWKERVIEEIVKNNNEKSDKYLNDIKYHMEKYNDRKLSGKDILWFDIDVNMSGSPIITVRILHGDIIFDEDSWYYTEFLEYIDFITEQLYVQIKSFINDYIANISSGKQSYDLQWIKSETLYDYEKNENNRNMYEKFIDNKFHKVYYEIKYTFDYVQNSF